MPAGSSSGMGFYCAEALAQRGAHVVMAARSLERTEKAAQMIRVQPSMPCPCCAVGL